MKVKGPKNLALLEFRNAVQNSNLVIQSALLRKESRGLQYITDYPKMIKNTKHHSIYLCNDSKTSE